MKQLSDYNDYNDYINLTKSYLRNYRKFQTSVKNLRNEIKIQAEILEKVEDVSSAIAKYGDSPGGGMRELNSVEATAERHLQMQKELLMNKADVERLEMLLKKIDNAMESLRSEDREIVREYIIDGENAYTVADRHHYSERWMRSKAKSATKDIAIMLFGMKASPVQRSFVFAD